MVEYFRHDNYDCFVLISIIVHARRALSLSFFITQFSMLLYRYRVLFCNILPCRMTKALEEVQRSLAFQEMRRRRDKLALDNVRLGRMGQVRSVSSISIR